MSKAILDLLQQWEETREATGQELTPEELSPDATPEELELIRFGMDSLKRTSWIMRRFLVRS